MTSSASKCAPVVTVFITGAAGRVGRHLSRLLGEQDRYCLRLSDVMEGEVGERPVEKLDLLDPEGVVAATRGVDAIVHCAIASYPDSLTPLEEEAGRDYHNRMLEVNIKGTYNIYEAARINGIPRVVYISSLTVAMGHGRESDFCEDLPPQPVDVYGCTKLFGESLAGVYHRNHGVASIVLRLGQPFPLGLQSEDEWKKDHYTRSCFVTHGDIMHAVDCALSASHVHFGIYNVISINEERQGYGMRGQEIGFSPREHWWEFDSGATVGSG